MIKHLGELEQTLMLAVLRLGEEAYGLKIRELVQRRTGRKVTHGAAYATLDRLVEKGHLQSELGEPTPGRGGRRRRYFRPTEQGLQALRASRAALLSLWSGLEDVLGETP